MTPEEEQALHDEVFNPAVSDLEYLKSRLVAAYKRALKELEATEDGPMLTCASCGGRYIDAPGNAILTPRATFAHSVL